MQQHVQPMLAAHAHRWNPGLRTPEGSPRWPSRRCLADVPSEVLAVDEWSRWRRLALLPDDRTSSRIKAWRQLVRLGQVDGTVVAPRLPGGRLKGIFGGSRVYWDHLVGYGGRGTKFEGMASRGARATRASIKNPHGPLTVTTTVNDFACTITDIEGISASKSSDLYFDSVDAFGRYYREYHGAGLTQEGLDSMLSHSEVRVIHSPGVDSLSVAMWDGRLFLDNAGGSHHFAGAAHIARAIGKSVSISARLHLHWLNVPAWEWLLVRHRVVHAPARPRLWSRADVAKIVGECFAIELPPRFGGGELVLVPRAELAIEPLINVLAGHGCVEVTDALQLLLRRQDDVRGALAERWQEICIPPWLGRGSATSDRASESD